jgi:hypothetical protein
MHCASYAPPGVQREGVALETPTILFIVGGRAREAYPAADLGKRLARDQRLARSLLVPSASDAGLTANFRS